MRKKSRNRQKALNKVQRLKVAQARSARAKKAALKATAAK